MLAWLCAWIKVQICMAQLMPLPLTISCSSKIQIAFNFLVLPFWCWLTRVVLDIIQEGRKMVVCVCVCACMRACLRALYHHSDSCLLGILILTLTHPLTFLLQGQCKPVVDYISVDFDVDSPSRFPFRAWTDIRAQMQQKALLTPE